MQPFSFRRKLQAACYAVLQSKKLMLSFLLFFGTLGTLMASHFRYGLVTATRLSETATTVTYRINVSEAWRLGAAPGSTFFSITGGNTGSFSVATTTVTDPSGGWSNSTGSYTLTLNKTSTPTRIASASCCKISTLVNNRDGNWDEYIVLNTAQSGSSPVSSMPAIINMPINASAASFTVPASDPDPGSTLTFGTPNFTTGQLAGQSEPSGFAVTSTGVITMNTVGKTVGQLYNAMVTVTDNHGNQIMLDFIIQMVGASNPPVFDYTVTPASGTVFNVIAGQNLNFPIRATDIDAGSTVRITASGLPSYITVANFTPNLPVTANPVNTTFSWTPAAAQIGTTNVLNFVATDNVGVQTTTSVTIKVVAEPAPVFVSPTPIQSSLRQIQTGVLHNDTIKAQSSLGSNVSISLGTWPSGATTTPTIPTTGTNPGLAILNWTPTPANFGQHNLSFTASIAAFPTIFTVRNYSLIVNTPPAFSSTPTGLTINVGQPFSYNVTINDPDIPYGDTVDIIGASIPSWLTLVSTGNGTAVLSGTPSFADGGTHHIHLEAEDIYHHGNPDHVEQEFEIEVITCISPVITCPSNIVLNNDAGACGAVANFLATATGTNPAITYSVASGSFFAVGTTLVKVYATNDCGIDSCSFTITVTDVENPIITCTSTIQKQNDAGKCGATIRLVNPIATDNCAIASIVGLRSDSLGLSADFSVGTTTITWTATDTHGLTAVCTQNVIITDTETPIVITQPVTIALDATGNASITANQLNNGSTDNCGIASIALNTTNFTCANLGSNTVELSVTDIHGNTATANAIVTLVDNIAPAIFCPNSVTLSCQGNTSVGALGTATATDNCSATVSYADVSTQDPSLTSVAHYNYTITRTWTAIDPSGNTASCVQTITVQDVTAPTALAKPITVYLDATGAAAITAQQIDNNSSDICSPVSLQVAPASFTCANVGANNVVLTVKDVSGNTATANAIVTLIDNIKPIVNCFAAQVICQNAAGSYAIPSVVANDNCSVVSISYSISGATSRTGTGVNASGLFNVGLSTILFTVVDASGNTSTCTTSVRIHPTPVVNITTSTANDFCNKLTLTANGNQNAPFSFVWNLNNISFATTPAIQLDNTNSDGNYVVNITDANGCTSLVAATYNYQKQNILSNYTILASEEVELHGYNKVLSGSVGIYKAGGKVEFEKYASITGAGAFIKAPKIEVETGASVPNRIIGVATASLPTMQYNTASTYGLPTYFVMQNQTATLSGNYKNLTIRRGANVVLNGSIFGNLSIEEGATVRFTATTLNINNLSVGRGPNNGSTTVKFADNTSIRVTNKVSIEEDCFINPDALKVTFYLGSSCGDDDGNFHVKGGNTTVIANVYAPTGEIEVKGGTNCHNHTNQAVNMIGLFIAQEVESEGKYVNWSSYTCTAANAAPVANFTEAVVPMDEVPVAKLSVKVAPNPTVNDFVLFINSNAQDLVSIKVTDAYGKLVTNMNNVQPGSAIKVGSNFANGIYFAEITQGKQRTTIKLIKGN